MTGSEQGTTPGSRDTAVPSQPAAGRAGTPHAPVPAPTRGATAGPAFPAAPTVPLSAVLGHAELRLRRIAGPPGERHVAMVHTTEWEDPTPYLLGGELLLTAGRHLPAGPHEIDRYVRSLVEAGVAALGFGVAPVHAEVPAELRTACDRHGMPLLRVPPRTPFTAIGRVVHLALAEARSREAQRVSKAQAALASAAARPDAVEAVLRQLASHLGAWAVLLDGAGHELFNAGTRPAEPVPRRLRTLAGRLTPPRQPATTDRPSPERAPDAATEHHDGTRLIAHRLAAGETGTPLVLGIAGTTRDSAVDQSVTGVGVVLLSLLTGPRHALGGDSRNAAALVRLLLGTDPAQVAPLLHPAAAPDRAEPTRWIVVHGRRTGTPTPGTRPPTAPVHTAALGTALGTPYLEIDGDTLCALVPVDDTVPDGHERHSVRAFDTPARLGWTLGVSPPAAAADLRLAATRAERALRRALGSGRPAVRDQGDELSLHALVAPGDAQALAHTRFLPLDDCGPPGAGALLETLRTWLSLHGSWDRTATALDLHRNTVRQRVARIGTLLDADLTDPDVRMELWFALRWLPGEIERTGPAE